jgi:nucleotide-binding universal stress UspA family protein
MDQSSPSSPVIVGIDGSTAALRAALWAVDEAVSRDTPLRLVHVVPAIGHDLDEALADARDVLHKAWTEVEATGKPVKIESDIVHGDPGQALIEASRAAQLVCVGSKGTHDSPRRRRASTAATLARGAASPVAVVRRRHTHKSSPFHKWIIAMLDQSPESHSVLKTAVDEGLLRHAPVLALTFSSASTRDNDDTTRTGGRRATLARYLKDAQEKDADIQVCALPMSDSILNLLEQSHTIDQLVIVGSSRPEFVDELLSSPVRKVLRKSNCSLLFTGNRAEAADDRANDH